jgi:alkylation response protein AidB-like acyl-CoA dehydrogenase
MDFTFTEEQQMMAAALRELTADLCAPPVLRALFDGEDAGAGERWQRLAELGLFGVRAPTASGGLGLEDADFVLLAEEAGRAALPEPLCEQAAVAVPALAELADVPAAAALLPLAASGEARIGLAHPQNPLVSVPPGLSHWLLCTPQAIVLAPVGAVTAPQRASVDAGRRLLEPDLAAATGVRLASGARAAAVAARVLNRGSVFGAAQCLGLTERMLALAADYARERVQFGKPIGSYQAVKHQLASVAVKLEFARPVVYAAVTRLAGLDARTDACASHAKLAAGDAADLAARTAIQVHGAMGYSWELDLHFFMKRAWALAGAFGERSFHARRLQSLVCAQLALGPDQTFAASG